MSNKDELIKITDIPQELLDDTSRQIHNYSTGLIKVTKRSAKEEPDVLIGSGTFVNLSDTLGILTAAHVVDELLDRPCSLGLVLSEHEHNYRIPSDYLQALRIAKGQNDSEGPDLAFIVLPSSELGLIKAKKSFHNLDIKRERILVNPPELDRGIWSICGVPGIKTINQAGKVFDSLQGFTMLCGFGGIRNTYILGEYDYCDFEIKYDSCPDIPITFGGISGGGLWQIVLGKSSTGTIETKEFILSGVVFYQTERAGLLRSIRCHGRNSIYDKAYSYIVENRKLITDHFSPLRQHRPA